MPARKNGKPDKNETSAATFARLAESRMNKAIRALRTLPSLGYYEHSKAQTTAMVDALAQEVSKIENTLNNPKTRPTESLFKF